MPDPPSPPRQHTIRDHHRNGFYDNGRPMQVLTAEERIRIEMAEAFRDSREDGDVAVVILTGVGIGPFSTGSEHIHHVICDFPIADLMAETRAWADRIPEVNLNTGEAQEGARAGLLTVSRAGVEVASAIIRGSSSGGNRP